MFSSRIMVVCPTSTPLTSVIASPGLVGSTPIFSPISTARGRGSLAASCAAQSMLNENAHAMTRSFLIIQVAYDDPTACGRFDCPLHLCYLQEFPLPECLPFQATFAALFKTRTAKKQKRDTHGHQVPGS